MKETTDKALSPLEQHDSVKTIMVFGDGATAALAACRYLNSLTF